MTSIQGTDPSFNYTHMYNIKDLQGPLPTPVFNQNSVLCALHQHGCFEKFIDLITRAGLAGIYNSTQTNVTMFIPMDNTISNEWLKTVDSYKAKRIVLYHTLARTISAAFLKSSKAMYLNTKIPGSKLLCERFGNSHPVVNRHSRILGCPIMGGKGTFSIFIIDTLLELDTNPLVHVDI